MTIAASARIATRVLSGRNTKTVSVTPTVQATPDYASGDVIGGKMTIAEAARESEGSGVVTWAHVFSLVDIGSSIPINVVFFNADPTNSTFTENSAFSVHADDLAKIVGVMSLDQRIDMGTPVALHVGQHQGVPFSLPSGTSLYAVAVAGGAINLASAADLTFVFGIEQD
jgi:hypothetical protein